MLFKGYHLVKKKKKNSEHNLSCYPSQKLNHCRSGALNQWFSSCLRDRNCYVSVHGFKLNLADSYWRVTLGRPLLFLIHINDIHRAIKKFQFTDIPMIPTQLPTSPFSYKKNKLANGQQFLAKHYQKWACPFKILKNGLT